MLFDKPMPYWNDHHQRLQQEIRTFVEHVATPIWHSRLPHDERFPWAARVAAAKVGLTGIDLSPAYGGRNADFVSQGIAFEECGRLDIDARELIGSGHGAIIARHGSPDLKEHWLPRIIRGEALIGVGITEEEAGSDIRSMKTMISSNGNCYAVHGKKSYISRINEAAAFIIFGKTHPDDTHLSAILVDTQNNPAIERTEIPTMGVRGWSYGSITIHDDCVPKENMLGVIDEGFSIFEEHFSNWRIFMALLCLGAAAASMHEVIAYSQTRYSFNSPIAKFQSIMFAIAESMSAIYTARLLCYQSLWLKDNGYDNATEAAMSKLVAVKIAFDAVNGALQIMGARGYTNQYFFEKRLRDIRGFMIADGTNEIMKSIISKDIFGKDMYNTMIGRGRKYE